MKITRPADLIQTRSHMAEWWSRPLAAKFAQGFPFPGPGSALAQVLSTLYSQCEAIYVPADTSVFTLAEKEPDFEVTPPIGTGMAFFEEPLIVTDVHGRLIAIRMISWITSAFENIEEFGVTAFYHQDRSVLDDLNVEMEEIFAEMKVKEWECEFPLFHVQALPLHSTGPVANSSLEATVKKYGPISPVTGQRFEETVPVCNADHRNLLVVLLSLWEHMANPVPAPLDRSARRRSERSTPLAPVRVLTIPSGSGGVAKGGEVEYSHRWKVREHKRHLKSGKITTVRSYIKGPKEKPLIECPTVYRVS